MAEGNREPDDDPYTNAWYAKQFKMLNHHWQRSMSEEADLTHQVRMMRKELDQIIKERAQDMAKIGELQERLDKAASTVSELRKAMKQGATV